MCVGAGFVSFSPQGTTQMAACCPQSSHSNPLQKTGFKRPF